MSAKNAQTLTGRPDAYVTDDVTVCHDRARQVGVGHDRRASSIRSEVPIAGGVVGHRYAVVGSIGEGGMGVVFSAYDPELDRRVALKVLRPSRSGATDYEWSARLAREAQAMARLSHPNVVNVFDVGVHTDGQVFLAMELVEGGSLRSWLESERRSVRDILDVFLQAGEGLAAAHEAGIVHRDFKPDNVLVGGDGRARVTDFGIARAGAGDAGVAPDLRVPREPSFPASSGSALENPITRAGVLMGTPAYMAPEQLEGASPDPRFDVFSFCISLWEALYGRRPFSGDTPRELAENRRRAPTRPPGRTRVPGWIHRALVRGLACAPEERYPTMRALLRDLRAQPSVRWTRALLVVGLVAGAIGAVGVARAHGRAEARECVARGRAVEDVWGDAQHERVREALTGTGLPYADAAWTEVRRLLDAYASAWAAASQEACAASRVRGEQSEAMLNLRVACLEDRRTELGALVDVLEAPDAKVVESAPKAAQGLSPVEGCADIDRLGASTRLPASPDVRAEIDGLQRELARAKALSNAGRRREALEVLQAMDARVEGVAWPPLVVAWHQTMGATEREVDEGSAVTHFVQAIALAESDHLDLAKAQAAVELASFEGSWMGLGEEAHRWMRVADGTIARLGGDRKLEVHEATEEAWIYIYEHKAPLAEPLFRRALALAPAAGAGLEDVAGAHSGLADALSAAGQTHEAVAEDEKALGLIEATYGRDHPSVAGYENNLAVILLADGRPAEALEEASRACAIHEAQAQRKDVPMATSSYGLALHTRGEVQLRLGSTAAAAGDLKLARDVYRAAHDEANPDIAYADNELALALRALHRIGEAERALDEAEHVEKSAASAPPTVVAQTLAIRAHLALDRGEVAGAVALGERALATVKGTDAQPSDVADARLVLAAALRRQHADLARAKELAEQACDGFAQIHDDAQVAAARAVLGSLEP